MKAEKGSAVIGSILGLTAITLVSISVILALMAGWNAMLIRDAAVSGARHGALADKTPADGERYTLKLLEQRMPSLANFQTGSSIENQQLSISVSASLPQAGYINSLSIPTVTGSAELERRF